MESQCLQVLLYAIESLNVKGKELKCINSWWNSVYRKIFGFNKWDSVIFLLQRLDVFHIVNMRRVMFIKRIMLSENSVMAYLVNLCINGPESVELQKMYNTDINWSCGKIKALTFAAFATLFDRG